MSYDDKSRYDILVYGLIVEYIHNFLETTSNTRKKKMYPVESILLFHSDV